MRPAISGATLRVSSTMARWSWLRLLAMMRLGSTSQATMSSGSATVLIQKPGVRTRERYSRATMTRTLGDSRNLGMGRVLVVRQLLVVHQVLVVHLVHRLHEDLLEGGLGRAQFLDGEEVEGLAQQPRAGHAVVAEQAQRAVGG